MTQVKLLILSVVKMLLASYAQVFFSKNLWFGAILLVVSFFHPLVGLTGLASVLTVALFAWFFRFDSDRVLSGAYTFNALLTGLGIGYLFEFSWQLLWVNSLVALLTFFVTLWFINTLGNRHLPYLSIPFLVGIWTVMLGAEHFSGLDLVQKTEMDKMAEGSFFSVQIADFIASLPIANAVYLYLRSMGAIFFQFSDFAGLLMSIGLFIHSRIAWLASVVGFGVGYVFYQSIEGDFSTLIYTYVGFNFILTSIAISGFFMVPSRHSFGVLLLIIPVTALVLAASHSLLTLLQLPVYSLPFNIVVLLFLSAMYLRKHAGKLNVVGVQHFSPEKNHYYFFNDLVRFRSNTSVQMALPVMGEWRISQGYHGGITHKGEWAEALDFDIVDTEGKTYRMPGLQNEDYYCYDLPVIAPATGWVETVVDNVPDNEVGQVNLQQNWGNTVVIKHTEYLYSKLSHLKPGTICVNKGDLVQKGQVLAKLGSSGRSPESHLHFQLQSTPYIGSKTLHFPISHYLVKKEKGVSDFKAYSIPNEGETVSNISSTRLLADTFNFTPGKAYTVKGMRNGKAISETWEACATASNLTYLWCPESRSTLWLVNTGALFYCTGYDGDQRSLLYLLYLGAYKVLLGYYPGLKLTDTMPLNGQINAGLKNLHDLFAPFFHFLKIAYQFQFIDADNVHEPGRIAFETQCLVDFYGNKRKAFDFQFEVEQNRLFFKTDFNNHSTEVSCELQHY